MRDQLKQIKMQRKNKRLNSPLGRNILIIEIHISSQ
jgi:hypothetical protein